MAAKSFSRFSSTTASSTSGLSSIGTSSAPLRELRYVEIPVDLSQSIKFSQINVESHKISCDPAFFIAALISPVKSLCPVPVPSDSSSTSCLSRASTASTPDWNTVVPFPTFNECSSAQVPLFFSKRYPDPKDPKLKNLRADKLLECFSDKIAKRKGHFHGPVVVFWRKSVDEVKHSMKLADFTLEHIKRVAPSILLPAAKQIASKANGSLSISGIENSTGSTPSSELSAPLSPRQTQTVPSKPNAWSSSLAATNPTPAATIEAAPSSPPKWFTPAPNPSSNPAELEQSEMLSRVVKEFLGNLSAKIPELSGAFEKISASNEKLRERIRGLEEELKEIKIKNDSCVNEVILARRETERCRELALADREKLRSLQADYDSLKEEFQHFRSGRSQLEFFQNSEKPSFNFKKSDVSSVWGNSIDTRPFETTVSEHQDKYPWSKGMSFLDCNNSGLEPAGGNSSSRNGIGNDGDVEEIATETQEKWFVTEVYSAEVPETNDNTTMWGTFEEGEIVTVQEKTPGGKHGSNGFLIISAVVCMCCLVQGWWYIIGARDQRGWYPEAFLLPVQT